MVIKIKRSKGAHDMKIKDLSLEMNDNNIKNIFFDWFCTNTELLRRGKN